MVLNGRVIAEKIKLTTNAYRHNNSCRIDQKRFTLLVMHAESLGLIPPNTGLLIIQDGATRHEIRFEVFAMKFGRLCLEGKDSAITSKYYSAFIFKFFHQSTICGLNTNLAVWFIGKKISVHNRRPPSANNSTELISIYQ
jgi:hypothetical protein